ncbi:MAG: hypothetical protein ACK5KL_01160 [Dysgonomonas sp.]
MKEETRGVITMTDNGIVAVSGHVRMSVSEIADLFGIYYRTAKRHIRAIEKAGIAQGDYTMSCIADRLKVYPSYYGLEMIIALSFRIQSKNATLFRERLMERVSVNHLCQKNNLSYFSLN